MSDFVAISCPFCGGLDFDKIGLKIHLESGHCDEYNETPRCETFPVLDHPADASKLTEPCPKCHGDKKLKVAIWNGDEWIDKIKPCPACQEGKK